MKVLLGSSWQDGSGRWHRLDVTVEEGDLAEIPSSSNEIYKALVSLAERYVIAGLVKFNGISPEEARERMRVISG